MKTSLRANYYQLLIVSKDTNSGFTLIELLVVILIIGILSVIGFNSFLNFAPKAKQSEAKTAVSSINAAQNSYVLEHPTFASNIAQLSLGLPTTTTNYTYTVVGGDVSVATVNADTTNTALKSYAGAVQKYNDANNKVVVASVICESATAGTPIAVLTSGIPGIGTCAANKELGQ